MKKRLLLTVFVAFASMMAIAQEMVLECSYTSNQSYKTLLVITAEGGEAVSIGGGKKCHYDLDVQSMGNHVVIYRIRHGKVKLVGGLYVRSLSKKIHQFREIEKFCEPCPRPVPRPFRSKLNRRLRFAEGRRPCVEVGQTLLVQHPVL